MIRAYLTSWSYRPFADNPNWREAVNPIMLGIEQNPQFDVEYAVISSSQDNITGDYNNPNCIVILKGTAIPDAVDNLTGVKRIPLDKLDLTIGDIPAAKRQTIQTWLQTNTGVDTSQFNLQSTLKQVLKAVIQDIQPAFTSLGAVYDSLNDQWE